MTNEGRPKSEPEKEPRFEVAIHRRVQKKIEKIEPESVRRNIVKCIADLENEPRPPNAVKLRGSKKDYRIRVGDYRLLYEIDFEYKLIQVRLLMHRSEGYKKYGY